MLNLGQASSQLAIIIPDAFKDYLRSRICEQKASNVMRLINKWAFIDNLQ